MARRTLLVVALAMIIPLFLIHDMPAFVSKLQHPWFKKRSRLLRVTNPKRTLCNFDSLTAELFGPIPDDLFETLEFTTWRNKEGWNEMEHMASDLLDCPRALQQCRNVSIGMNPPDESYSAQNFSEIILEVFGKMDNLNKIEWRMGDHEVLSSTSKVVIPSVKHLVLYPNKHFILVHTPNVEKLTGIGHSTVNGPSEFRMEGVSELLDSAKQLTKLTNLSLLAAWSPSVVDKVFSTVPRLQNLTIEGWISSKDDRLEGKDARNVPQLQMVMSRLRQFPNLESLQIPYSEDLKSVGNFDGMFCGNMFDGVSGAQFARRLVRENIWARETSSKIVLEQLPNLKSLTIEGMSALSIEKGVATWPWTGRIEEYLWEREPLFPGGYTLGGLEDAEEPGGPVFGHWELDKKMLREDWVPDLDPWF